MKCEKGRARMRTLLADADIFLHNMRPGSLEKLGLDPAAVRAKWPRLIYCDIGAFGHIGPLKDQPGYEPLMQAYGGLISINGHPDGPVARVAVSLIDIGTGMWTAVGALAALHHRHQTGEGCTVNTSLFETALAWGNFHMAEYQITGEVPARQASGHPAVVPYQAFEGSDGPFMILAGNDRLFVKLANALDKPEWIEDPRYKTNANRVVHRDEILAAVQAAVGGARGYLGRETTCRRRAFGANPEHPRSPNVRSDGCLRDHAKSTRNQPEPRRHARFVRWRTPSHAHGTAGPGVCR